MAILLASVSLHGGGLHGHLLATWVDVSILFGLPFFTAHADPASKWLTEINTSKRSLVTVNDEMPISYLDPTDGMIESKFAVSGSLQDEHLCQSLGDIDIEADRGLTRPPARNSTRAYDVSMPMVSLPSFVT